MCSLRARIRWMKLLLPLLVCGLVCELVTPAHAAANADDGCLNEPVCSGHYQKALSFYESGRYEAALPEFQAAYASRQMPWLLINIGRTFHRLGRLDEAITMYYRYEQAVPNGDPETLKKVREYKAQAEVLVSAKNTTPPPPTETPPPVAPVDPTPAPPPPQPRYKKWWFWTAIGGGVAVVVITGIAIGVATSSTPASGPPPYPTGTPVYMPMF
jgi:hypothetical protein